jgi:hypothetical protein
MIKKLLIAAALTAGLALTGAGAATAKEKAAAVGAQLETKAVVESVDVATRKVLLRAEDGSLQTVTVGPEVRNLPQVKAGDHVLIRIRLGVVAQMAGANESTPPVAQADVVGRAPDGDRPAALVGDALRVRVTFNAYDPKTKLVQFTLPTGEQKSTVLRTKTMQDFAAGLKPNDKVDVTFVRSFAIAVVPA